MDIGNLGGRTIDLLFQKGLIRSPSDLYQLTYEDIFQLEGFKDLSTRNLLNGIKSSKSAPFDNVLFALGIRYVGKTVAEKLAQYFKNIDELAKADFDILINVPEIGERIAESVLHFFKDPTSLEEIEKLRSAGINMVLAEEEEPASDVLEGKSFVVSGVFEHFSRDGIKEAIKKNGGKVVSYISAKLDFLVAGDKMGPAKKQKAEALGIAVLSENDFIKMLNGQEK